MPLHMNGEHHGRIFYPMTRSTPMVIEPTETISPAEIKRGQKTMLQASVLDSACLRFHW